MKITKNTIIALLAMFIITACKKDKEERVLEGRWDLLKNYSLETSNGVKTSEETINYKIGDTYLIFKGNTYEAYRGGGLEDAGTFSYSDNSITLNTQDGVENAVLRWVTNTEFIIDFSESYTNNGTPHTYKSELTYKKQ